MARAWLHKFSVMKATKVWFILAALTPNKRDLA